MGEAKRRGTPKERQAQGIVKRLQRARDKAKAEAEYEASLTPEQREKRQKARAILTAALGIAAGSMPGRK